ncbi:hypothetical protein ACHAXH_002353 [Discostella pseudostelligera]
MTTHSTPSPKHPTEIWLLVVAHPDDESMFFIPTLRNLVVPASPPPPPSRPRPPPCDKNNGRRQSPPQSSQRAIINRKVGVLCLSNGDYRSELDGPIREKEMHVACSLIGNNSSGSGNQFYARVKMGDDKENGIEVTVLNDVCMKDGPDVVWSSEYISQVVLDHIQRQIVPASVACTDDQDAGGDWDYIQTNVSKHQPYSPQQDPPSSTTSSQRVVQSINLNILTFDEGGVSGHTNHVDVYRGIRYLLHDKCHVTSSGVDDKHGNVSSMLQLCRRKTSSDGGGGDDIIEMNVTVHTLNTISNPLYKYFLWAFVDLFPFLLMWLFNLALYLFYFFIGALPWMERKNSTRMRQFSGVDNMQFRLMDPVLVWRAMAAHHSQFVWYRRLSVMFSRYTFMNDLQTMAIDNNWISSVEDDADGNNMITSILPPVVTVQEKSTSPQFLLTQSQMNALRESVIPPFLCHRPWTRIYSLVRDGDSFVAFQKRVTEWCTCPEQQSTLLVVKTTAGGTIGGYSDVPLINLSSSVVGGAGRSCLFKLLKTTTDDDDGHDPPSIVEVYGKNCTATSKKIVFDAYRRIIAFGGGEKSDRMSDDEGFGLSLEDGFTRGTTARCAAFDNEPLVSDRGGVFDIVDVEVWGFVFGQL